MNARADIPVYAPGRYSISNEEYQAAPAVSKSRLDEFSKSPRHYYLRYEAPNRPVAEQTDALIIGSASHCAVLEPDLFPSRYVCPPPTAPKRPSVTQLNAKKPSEETVAAIEWWARFNEDHAGKVILTPDQFAECLALRDCVHADKNASTLLEHGDAEQSFFAIDPETELLRKVRPDFITDGGVFIDLKFVRDASPWGFGRACASYRYDVQAAYYPDTVALSIDASVSEFIFIAVEKNPHGPVCATYYCEPEMIISGRTKYQREIAAMAECRANRRWPGYTPDIQNVLFPTYAMQGVDMEDDEPTIIL